MSILEKFTVIDLIKTRSASVATVTSSFLKFNIQTAGELHYTPYIQVLINPKDKQFAIRGCKEDAPNAVAFSKPEGEQKYQIKISTTAAVDMIRKMANWTNEESWSVPGVYFADDDALVYDLSAAYKVAPRGRRAAKIQEETVNVADDFEEDDG